MGVHSWRGSLQVSPDVQAMTGERARPERQVAARPGGWCALLGCRCPHGCTHSSEAAGESQASNVQAHSWRGSPEHVHMAGSAVGALNSIRIATKDRLLPGQVPGSGGQKRKGSRCSDSRWLGMQTPEEQKAVKAAGVRDFFSGESCWGPLQSRPLGAVVT